MLLGNCNRRAIWLVAFVILQQVAVLARTNVVPHAVVDSRSDVNSVPQLDGFEERVSKRARTSYLEDDETSDDQGEDDDATSQSQGDKEDDAISQGQDVEEEAALKNLRVMLVRNTATTITYDFVAPKEGEFARGFLEITIMTKYDESASPVTPNELFGRQIEILNHPINQDELSEGELAIKPTDWKSMIRCDLIEDNDGTRTLRTIMKVTGRQFGKSPYRIVWMIGQVWSVEWRHMKSRNKNRVYSTLHAPATTGFEKTGKSMFAVRVIFGREYSDEYSQEEGVEEPRKARQKLLDQLARRDGLGPFMQKNKDSIEQNMYSYWATSSPGHMRIVIVFQDEKHLFTAMNRQLFSKAASRLYGVPVEDDMGGRFVKYRSDYKSLQVDSASTRISYGQLPAAEGEGTVLAVRVIFGERYDDKDDKDDKNDKNDKDDKDTTQDAYYDTDSSDSWIGGPSELIDEFTPGSDLPDQKLRWMNSFMNLGHNRMQLEYVLKRPDGWDLLVKTAEWARKGEAFAPALVLVDEARVVKDEERFLDVLGNALGLKTVTKLDHFRPPERNREKRSIVPYTPRIGRSIYDSSDDGLRH